MSYSWGGGFGGNAVVGVGNNKNQGNNGVGWGVGGVPPGADNSNKAAPPGQVGKSDAATEISNRAATASTAAAAAATSSGDSSWGGFRGGSWGPSNTAGSGDGFSTGRLGGSGLGGSGRGGDAAAGRGGTLGGSSSFGRGGSTDGTTSGFSTGRGGEGRGRGSGDGSRTSSAGGGDRGSRGFSGGGDNGGFSTGRGGGDRGGRGGSGDGGAGAAADGGGRGSNSGEGRGSSRGEGGGRGEGGQTGRGRRMMSVKDDVVITNGNGVLAAGFENWGVAGWGRQLMQIAGVSAGAVATVSGPQGSLGDLTSQSNFHPELPPGSDYRSAWADQANSQALGQASMGRKRLVLLGGIDYWGLLLLGVSLLLVLMYLLIKLLVVKRRATNRLRMDPCYSGAFRLAAARGDVRTMQAIADGCPGRFHVNADHEGFTALHAAAVEGKVAALLWLCQQGADVSLMKDDGWRDTALHYAAAKGHTHCCQVLLAYGADLHAKNYAGQTPADVAARSGYKKLSNFLNRYATGQTPKSSIKTLPVTLKQQLSAALQQYSDALRMQVLIPANAPAAKATTKTMQTAACKEGVNILAQAVAAMGPLNTVGTRSRSITAASLTDQAAAAVNKVQGQQKGCVAADAVAAAAVAAARSLAKAAGQRGWDGVGTQGTQLAAGVRIFRVIATITQLTAAGYIVWRALRTLNPGWSYLLSVPIWLCEFAGFMMSNAFIVSLWNQIIRPPRKISEMLDDGDVPAVDVYVPTYSEPVSVLEPTVIAALNMTWPGSKLCVYVLDDGARPEVAQMVQSVKFQLLYMGREAELVYVARQKVKGVDHHAKAGNINSALLKEAPGKGTFLLVLDCDMIIHPNFLQNILGHFYKPADTIAAVTAHNQKHSGVTVSKKSADDGVTTDLKTSWVLKDKAGFIQTPQDFWNVDATDPLVHSARFFYGPMLQGRDGIGACPCCGTGVVFRRDALIAMGGQSYGSITEDYNTAMNMLGAGFSTMFLNERLVFGMAPDDLPTALQQRLRWAMGALQILSRTNPLTVPGLTFTQSLLFFEALAHHWLAIATVLLAILPIPFLFTGYSPVVAPAMWEFTLAFGVFYTFNRIMLWWVHRHVEGGSQEMWRGSQMWVWISPNHIRAIWKVLVAENWLMKRIFNFEITFAVTKKDKDGDGSSRWDSLYSTMGVTWPYIIWLLGFLAGLCYFIVKACMGLYSAWEVVVYLISIMWGTLVLLSIWPPLSSLLPREETEEGWKICWDAVLPLPASRAQRATQRAALQDKSMHPGQVLRQQKAALQPISLDSLDSTTPAASTSAAAAAQDDYVVPDFDDALLKHHQPETQSLRHQHSTGSSVDNDPALPADIVVSHVARDQQIDRNQRGAGLGWHSFEVSSNIVHSQEKLERSGSGLLHRKSRRRSHADQSYAEPAHTVLPFTGVDVIDYQLHRRAPGALRGSAADAAPRRMSHDMRQGSSRMSGIWMLPHITEDTGVGSHDKSNKGHALEVSAIDDDILPDMSPLSAAGILHGPQRGTVSSFSGAVGPTDTAAAVNPKAAAPNNGLLASMSTTLRRRMSFLDPHPRHHTADHLAFLTTTDIVPFSASAAAARAVGPAAFGRIGLPGRTRHMMEASSLYTHVILPEPGISVGGSRVADSQRLLAVGTDGMLMPLSTASGATLSHHTLPGHQEETEESHGLGSLQQPGVRSAAEDLKVRHDSGSSSSKSSSPTAVEDGEATVMEVVAAAGAGVAGLVNSEVQHQLQQLATAVTLITEQIENAPATTNELAECDTVKVNNSSNNTAAAAGIVPVFGNNGRQYSLTLHRAGSTKPTMEIANWAALGSIFGANRILQSLNYTQMFNSHCAVIPTLPENIYDHTIAAVPNFNERQTPKASWMFVLVNFSLLVVLFAASLVEVYVG